MTGSEQAIVLWVVIFVLAAATEMFTMAFVAMYVGLGAAAAAVAAWLDYGTVGQLVAFGVVGVVLLLATRPFLARRLQHPEIMTNVHVLVGKRGVVTVTVDDTANTGQIRVGTEYWTARHADGMDGAAIPEGGKVEVVEVSGVTARVRPVPGADDSE